MNAPSYSPTERLLLIALAAFGFIALNGAFVYGLLLAPDAVRGALTNPIAAAFVIEALVLVPVIAYLLRKWHVTGLHWGWFVFLSLLGGLAFSLPIAALSADQRR